MDRRNFVFAWVAALIAAVWPSKSPLKAGEWLDKASTGYLDSAAHAKGDVNSGGTCLTHNGRQLHLGYAEHILYEIVRTKEGREVGVRTTVTFVKWDTPC